jgi:general secretion pathway protein G
LRKDVPLDPWQRPYVYRIPGQHGDYDLYSMGADGQEGGDGDNADVTSWK